MSTLKEIDQKHAAKREYLRKLEILTDAVMIARSRVAALERRVAAPDTEGTALTTILSVVDDVPDSIRTRGDELAPGGYIAKGVLRKVAAEALADVTAKRRRFVEEVPEAKDRLAQAEAALERHTGQQTIHAGDLRAKLPEIKARGTGAVR